MSVSFRLFTSRMQMAEARVNPFSDIFLHTIPYSFLLFSLGVKPLFELKVQTVRIALSSCLEIVRAKA